MVRLASFPSLAFAAPVFAADATPIATAQDGHTVVAADSIQWAPAPPSLPKGAQIAMLSGNPGKDGPFTLRVKFPDGYVVPPHWHSKAEYLTVISGRLNVGMGDKVDKAKTQPLAPGGFVEMPAKMHHYVWASGETVVQVNGMGPFDVNYIDPKDDPRQATTGAR